VITWPFFCHSLLINLLTDDQGWSTKDVGNLEGAWLKIPRNLLKDRRKEGCQKKRKICSGNNFYRCSPWTCNSNLDELLIILLTSFILILLLIGTILTHIICPHHILHYTEQDKNCKIHLENVFSISMKQQNCFKKVSILTAHARTINCLEQPRV
jgi:hypothetical protein